MTADRGPAYAHSATGHRGQLREPEEGARDLSRTLRERGWLVPAYTMPPKREDLAVLRVVVRNGFSHDMAELFLRDLRNSVRWLGNLGAPMPHEEKPRIFHH